MDAVIGGLIVALITSLKGEAEAETGGIPKLSELLIGGWEWGPNVVIG